MTTSGSPKVPGTIAKTNPKSQVQCGACDGVGHTKRWAKCPFKLQNLTPTHDRNQRVQILPPPSLPDDANVVHFVHDIESTGLDKTNDEIIELSGTTLDKYGDEIPGTPFFESLIKPRRGVGSSVEIQMLKDAKDFNTVDKELMTWIKGKICNDPCKKVCLVAYNMTTHFC
ncbi:unnamed protein product [Cylindrotheca closterium]|uniref:Uncharacterized protein n=1 Tax=Cylindrotheca closterium TaxID=2856 RepID=A0AAD2PXT5_9STRA|nr:unnamed protein product [Cylindrotheca closterium]